MVLDGRTTQLDRKLPFRVALPLFDVPPRLAPRSARLRRLQPLAAPPPRALLALRVAPPPVQLLLTDPTLRIRADWPGALQSPRTTCPGSPQHLSHARAPLLPQHRLNPFRAGDRGLQHDLRVHAKRLAGWHTPYAPRVTRPPAPLIKTQTTSSSPAAGPRGCGQTVRPPPVHGRRRSPGSLALDACRAFRPSHEQLDGFPAFAGIRPSTLGPWFRPHLGARPATACPPISARAAGAWTCRRPRQASRVIWGHGIALPDYPVNLAPGRVLPNTTGPPVPRAWALAFRPMG